ncbi:tetratricopeptide repeat protein [Mucilaginibacter sp. E4BP6]|uniref:ATP-binding protein n=1 Tax=Mucilaginibacter sp. E4BP6 TaxID=2723089 RepID=UPI0015CB5093|nr:ATP-binding protein [Mucilaginibacter sp. E4BP6]NYE66043.1 tetratricopeptide (TPR) repeat protein [Mucilaginibacter sp. E4BP6]
MNQNENVAVNSLYYFNAHTKNDEDVVNTFIARKPLLKSLEDSIDKERGNTVPKHLMIIGSRGMGKSTLLRRLEISIRKGDLNKRFIPILFPEEQYNIDRLSKFWLNSLDSLADNFEEEKNFAETDYLDDLIKELTSLKGEKEISEKAYFALLEICKKYNRKPVFLIDNFDILFDGISKEQQTTLYGIITSNQSPIFIGACSYNPIEDVSYDSMFYDVFENIILDRLTQTEMRELLLLLADKTGKGDVFEDIYNKTAQLDALHSLTGGNPRIAVFIFQLLANGLSEKIFENLNALLDLITPLYKSNFEQLSKQSQVIVDALALNWDPCDLDQLHFITKLENNQLSAQLDRLIKAGWIDRSNRYSEEKNKIVLKIKNYSIRERFFNIWYIMRRASRRQRGDLKSLTCFLETFYTPQHLAIEKLRIIKLLKEKLDPDKITYGLALSRAYNRDGSSDLENNIYLEILEQTEGNLSEVAKYMNPDNIPDNIFNDFFNAEGKRWRDHIQRLFSQKEFQKARQFITSVLNKRPNNGFALRKMADAYFREGLYSEATLAYRNALKINPNDSMSWIGIASIQELNNDDISAEEAYKHALDQGNDVTYFKYRYASFLRKNMRYDEAENIVLEALETSPGDNFGEFLLIAIYIDQKRIDEAEKLADECFHSKKEDKEHINLIHFLMAIAYKDTDRVQRAIEEFQQILGGQLYENPSFWFYYGEALKLTNQNEEAEDAYRQVIKFAPDNVNYLFTIANFLKEKRFKYGEAETIFKRLSILDPKNPDVWIALGDSYTHRGIYKKAGVAFKKATQVAPEYGKSWGVLGISYQYLNDEPQKASEAYIQCLKINPNIESIWEALADLNHFSLKSFKNAENAYVKALEINPTNNNVLSKYLMMLIRSDDNNSAISVFEKYRESIKLNPFIFALQEALFAINKDNNGDASNSWLAAITNINLTEESLDLIKYAAAISVMKGFGNRLLDVFKKSQGKQHLRPLFEAIKTLVLSNPEYLNNIAEEIRETAQTIYKDMTLYIS